jgi:hypothetical protein
MESWIEMRVMFPAQFSLESEDLRRQLVQKIDEHFRGLARPSLRDAWRESVFNPRTGAFEPGHFCKVADPGDARLLERVQLCLTTGKSYNGVTTGFAATFAVPEHAPAVREQWRKAGHNLQVLQKADEELARIGAVQDSGMFVLPGRYLCCGCALAVLIWFALSFSFPATRPSRTTPSASCPGSRRRPRP